MKKTILFFVLVLTSGLAKAQFELTPNGFVDKENKDKDYIVLEVAGKNKAELYKSTLLYLNTLYSNPKETISAVDGESISVNAIDDSTISTVLNGYSLVFEFKDGKIRIKPSYALYYYSSINGLRNEYEIFNDKGKLKRAKDKERLEGFYNGYVAIIKKNAEKKAEDW
ncbi:hypothetical protein DBR40_09095 [Pedobacter sp. KBW01]|uniref:hypothetical protein n=1 Tax=Pedobacter sp. KBW01 TaxID=2153364 RepID=UPI000F5915FD|nr:hypothetical protein [Pedobacter sp. KBW01]RQO78095.1 hypothetical protein DBR40_09095 [Pedobacter sp. KBW01]